MRATIAACCVLLFSGCGPPVDPMDAPPFSEEEATVRSLDEQERVALLHRDTVTLERLWSDRLTVNASNNQVVADPHEMLALIHAGTIHYDSVERTIEAVRVDPEIAILMGTEVVQPIGTAPLAGRTVQQRFTHFWRREHGTWRLMARHVNVTATR